MTIRFAILATLLLATTVQAQTPPHPDLPNLEAERRELCAWADRQIAISINGHSVLLRRLNECMALRPPNCPPNITRGMDNHRELIVQSDAVRRAMGCPQS
jgi:hypothetical protein